MIVKVNILPYKLPVYWDLAVDWKSLLKSFMQPYYMKFGKQFGAAF